MNILTDYIYECFSSCFKDEEDIYEYEEEVTKSETSEESEDSEPENYNDYYLIVYNSP